MVKCAACGGQLRFPCYMVARRRFLGIFNYCGAACSLKCAAEFGEMSNLKAIIKGWASTRGLSDWKRG